MNSFHEVAPTINSNNNKLILLLYKQYRGGLFLKPFVKALKYRQKQARGQCSLQ